MVQVKLGWKTNANYPTDAIFIGAWQQH